jgi:putative redox protein
VVEAEAQRAPDDPKIFTRIHFKYHVSGAGLNPAQVERAVKLSKEKYCSATLMLGKMAEISYEVAIDDRPGDPVPV